MTPPARFDLYCRVVDHFGDIGIGWRLARQLVDGATRVRLVVDDLAAFARIEPRVDAARARQWIGGVDVVRWSHDDAASDLREDLPDVVVELLGCGLPEALVAAMADATTRPVWIDYEHLSAESWVERFHGLPSPHPRLPLVKHFFYPGFGARTGGLLVEPGVDRRRRAVVDDAGAVRAWRGALGIPADGTRVLSLFAYPHAPLAGLLDALGDDGGWTVVVPDGVLVDALAAWRATRSRGPSVVAIPFVDQDDYDRLVWTCDVNVVRGEDSFVRAQVAGRPFVWHIYRQPDEAHRAKLAAFADLRAAAAGATAAALAERRFQDAWNDPAADVRDAARAWLAALPALATAADAWRTAVLGGLPLVERLRAFATERFRG